MLKFNPKKVSKIEPTGVLKLDTFQCFLDYFKERYIEQGKPNDRFKHLLLRRNDKPELVKNVLKGIETDLGNILAALLIIIYRYRNNFFHGIKWAYSFHDQLGNFTNANQLLAMVADEEALIGREARSINADRADTPSGRLLIRTR